MVQETAEGVDESKGPSTAVRKFPGGRKNKLPIIQETAEDDHGEASITAVDKEPGRRKHKLPIIHEADEHEAPAAAVKKGKT